MKPKKRSSSCQSSLPASSTRSSIPRGTTNTAPSTSSIPINIATPRALPRQPAVFLSQQTHVSIDRADLDPNGSLSATYSYASPQPLGNPDHQQASMIAISTQSNGFGNTAQGTQTSPPLPFAGMGNPNFTDGHLTQSTRRRRGGAAIQSFPSLTAGYAPFTAPPSNAATPGPHAYSPYLGGGSLTSGGYSSNNVNLAVHQDTNAIAGNGQQRQLSPFTLPDSASYQQTSNTMDYASSTFASSMSEALEPFDFPLPSISLDNTPPPSFARVAHNMSGSVSLHHKEDFTEDHPMLISSATASTHNQLSVNTAVPTFLAADHTPISHSSSPLSAVEEDVSDEEEGKSPAPVRANSMKRKRVRKPVERDRARPFEDRYRGGLRGAFDAVGDALKVLRNELKPNDFRGKDHTFKPSKCKVLDGSLHAVKTLETVYSELEIAQARNAQLEQEVNQLKRRLANVSIDNKLFNPSTAAQGYPTHITTQ